jgi:integrase
VSKPSKHPTEKGLREKNGKWEYRFSRRGRRYSQVTDLAAIPETISEAQAIRLNHIAEIKAGKGIFRLVPVPLHQAVAHFMRWYRDEHPRGGACKWAASLMASFQFYFEQNRLRLEDIGPAEIEEFKAWRRQTRIHDNTLRKQLILLSQFFAHARKHRWMQHDPMARGTESEVKVPAERESTAMYVLSLDDERAYLAAAAKINQDLADVATIMLEQGARPDELLSVRQADVNLFARRFVIQAGKTENAHRTLLMTDTTFRVFSRRLARPGLWVFPSPKLAGQRRTTLQKSHEIVTRGRLDRNGKRDGGCGVPCRIYDMRHTFATRFAVGGGALPILAKILGHADLSLLMRYVHPSQADMDRAMEWYAESRKQAEKSGPRPNFRPTKGKKEAQMGLKRRNKGVRRAG